MARPVEFIPIHITTADEKQGRKEMREMLGRNWWRIRGGAVWAGFAAEYAITRAINKVRGPLWCRKSPSYEYDLALGTGPDELRTFCAAPKVAPVRKMEVKTRAVTDGWINPGMFDYVTVPKHGDKEPINDVDLVTFCWYSMADPRRLWVLGYVRGVEEFYRRAVFYRSGDALPRGGWAGDGGAYVIEVSQMRPLPTGMLKGDDE